MLAVKKGSKNRVVRIGSAELAKALKEGFELYKKCYDLFPCTQEMAEECDEKPETCMHWSHGVCSRKFYI